MALNGNLFNQRFQVAVVPPQSEGGHRRMQFSPLDLFQQRHILSKCQRKMAGCLSRALQTFYFAWADQYGDRPFSPVDHKPFPGGGAADQFGEAALGFGNINRFQR